MRLAGFSYVNDRSTLTEQLEQDVGGGSVNPVQVTGMSLVRRLQAQRAPCGQVEPHRQRVVPCLRMLLLIQRRAAAASSCSSSDFSRLLPEGGSLCRKLS